MATIYTVKKGDTLSEIAEKYYKTYSSYSTWKEYMNWLVVINEISNPNYIVVGQKLKMNGQMSPQTVPTSYKPTITQFGIISNDASERELYVSWKFGHSNVSHYVIAWEYCTNSVKWINGNSGENPTTTSREYKFSPPQNAVSVRVIIRPVAKTRKVNGKDTLYWLGEWGTYSYYYYAQNPPGVPTGLDVKIENTKLTASLENIPTSLNASYIEFMYSRIEDGYVMSSGRLAVNDGCVSWIRSVPIGYTYKVRCRACNRYGVVGEWSNYTIHIKTIPLFINSKSIRCTATSSTSVLLEWSAGSTEESYEIEYTTNKAYFDTSNETTKVSDIKTTKYEITKLTSGSEYFFRIRCKNSVGETKWSDPPVSVNVGSIPTKPTTWSSSATAVVGETLNLYWVHNSSDNSKQRNADIELTINGKTETHTITADPDEENEESKTEEIHTFSIDTSKYEEGTSIKWRVRTAGVTNVYSEWSIERTVDIYAKPHVDVKVTTENGTDLDGVIRSFPFCISALAGPSTQRPIGYHISIRYSPLSESIYNEYETIDASGTTHTVRNGDEIYSKHFNVSDDAGTLKAELTPGVIDLENNGHYTVTCTVAMNSGLTAEGTCDFTVGWEDVEYIPNAEIVFDKDTLSTNIRPFCKGHKKRYFSVIRNVDDTYTVDETNELEPSSDVVQLGQPYTDVYTETWEQVYMYQITELPLRVSYFCERFSEEETLVEDATLSVYRREYDGTFTEIQKDIPNNGSTWVIDPHPALDYARYRIVSTHTGTGAVSYCDLSDYPIGCSSAIIQWDEAWSTFDATEEDPLAEPIWSGSMIKLPYNIDVTNKHSRDTVLVEYIGRKRPVSYYGTQLGETATWNVEIPKSDVDTLYALRRLAIWSGDVYVREPSGSGYWANIIVSFSQKHKAVTIPVSFEITRVEGGA